VARHELRGCGYKWLYIAAIGKAISVHIGQVDVAGGIFRRVAGRVDECQDKWIHVQHIHHAIAVQIAEVVGDGGAGATEQHQAYPERNTALFRRRAIVRLL
jgi:hypothetical protein